MTEKLLTGTLSLDTNKQTNLSVDALSLNWDRIHGYAFPSFHIIPAILNKICSHQCKLVLIAPLWPQASWFPDVLQLLVDYPITLPFFPNLLTQLSGKFRHQNIQMLALHVWILSNNQSEIDNFRMKLPIIFPKQEDLPQERTMMQNGQSSLIGVIEGKFLLSQPLYPR